MTKNPVRGQSLDSTVISLPGNVIHQDATGCVPHVKLAFGRTGPYKTLPSCNEYQNNVLATLTHANAPSLMMWRRTYLLLILVRLYFAFAPSYIHPDENFQGPEVIAGMSSLYSLHTMLLNKAFRPIATRDQDMRSSSGDNGAHCSTILSRWSGSA